MSLVCSTLALLHHREKPGYVRKGNNRSLVSAKNICIFISLTIKADMLILQTKKLHLNYCNDCMQCISVVFLKKKYKTHAKHKISTLKKFHTDEALFQRLWTIRNIHKGNKDSDILMNSYIRGTFLPFLKTKWVLFFI